MILYATCTNLGNVRTTPVMIFPGCTASDRTSAFSPVLTSTPSSFTPSRRSSSRTNRSSASLLCAYAARAPYFLFTKFASSRSTPWENSWRRVRKRLVELPQARARALERRQEEERQKRGGEVVGAVVLLVPVGREAMRAGHVEHPGVVDQAVNRNLSRVERARERADGIERVQIEMHHLALHASAERERLRGRRPDPGRRAGHDERLPFHGGPLARALGVGVQVPRVRALEHDVVHDAEPRPEPGHREKKRGRRVGATRRSI
eukprot:31398-Pelagococcus_subviridis.AAC.15